MIRSSKILIAAAGFAALAVGAVTFAQTTPAAAPGAETVETAPPAPPAANVLDTQTIDLSAAFKDVPAAQGRTFRARIVELPPGAVTEARNNAGQPSITYVSSGSVLERRDGAAEPIAHAKGGVSFGTKDVTHAWENAGSEPAVLLIVDIQPPGAAQPQ